MKPQDLDIDGWSELLFDYAHSSDYERNRGEEEKNPPAFRIENTQFTVARYSGGFTMNGRTYKIFYPPIAKTATVAWLAVRDDFLRRVTKKLKSRGAGEKSGRNCDELELFK